jgi:dTDP-4-amino-4,6-dideoxygalactose transaminase
MHAQPVFSHERAFIAGTSDRLFATGVTLPSGSALTNAQIEAVITAIRTTLGVG